MTHDPDPFHKRLLARRAELITRLEGIEAELVSHSEQDWADLATEREEDEMLEGIGASGARELRRIDAALGRIAAGTFGLCTRCGAEIAPARLALLPDTPFCATCAA